PRHQPHQQSALGRRAIVSAASRPVGQRGSWPPWPPFQTSARAVSAGQLDDRIDKLISAAILPRDRVAGNFFREDTGNMFGRRIRINAGRSPISGSESPYLVA